MMVFRYAEAKQTFPSFSLCVLTVEWYDATSHTSFGGERKVEAKKSEVFRTEKNDEK